VSLKNEITELCNEFKGVKVLTRNSQFIIHGVISFNAHYNSLESIEDWFEVEISIPADYPKSLPDIKELQGKVHSDYDHLNSDSSFCLASPLAIQQAFNLQPTLLGFAKNLVIPYLYSYCYWKKYKIYPFGERSHGLSGIAEHYLDIFETEATPELFKGLKRIAKHGYRGHHPCPCGSGKIIRKCHMQVVQEISHIDAKKVLETELILIQAYLDKLEK